MLSSTAFAAMLRSWKKARLDTSNDALNYPKINILARARMGSPVTGRMNDDQVSDSEVFQQAVIRMPHEMRCAFEACHLGLINQKRYLHTSHKIRAQALGIAKSTYWYRVNAGKRFASQWIDEFLDALD